MEQSNRARIAGEVRRVRKERKLKQQELANELGVSLGMISGLERQISFPQPPNLRRILEHLEIPMEPGDEAEEPVVADGGWSGDVRVALNVIGLYLESYPPEQRAGHIDNLVQAVMHREL